jgi:predicted outer membrane repeat protein
MMMLRIRREIIAAVLAVLASVAAKSSGRVIYVDAKGPPDGTGSSWVTAFQCLQTALYEARNGDVIRMAQGIYQPDRGMKNVRRVELKGSGDRTATFLLVPGTTIRGGYAGLGGFDPNARDVHQYETILTGDLKGNDIALASIEWEAVNDYTSHPSRTDNSYCVVTTDYSDSHTVLDGVTITGGNFQGTNVVVGTGGSAIGNAGGFPVIIDCTLRRNTARAEGVGGYMGWGFRGGAVVSMGGQPTFRGCTFIENICFTSSGSGFGGAAYNDDSHSVYVDCLFERNVATGSEKDAGGGAICNHRSHPTLTHCTFRGNVALRSRGGCLYNFVNSDPVLTGCRFEANASEYGGAIYNLTSNPTLTDCIFLANKATNAGPGGAIVNDTGANPTVTNCLFFANTAEGGGAIYSGWNSKPVFVNCLFSANRAVTGGAIHNTTAQPQLANCTFSRNVADDKGGAIYSFSSQGGITNCICWDNQPEQIVADATRFMSTNNVIQGGWPGPTNLDANPLFVDADGPDNVAGTEDDDLRLLPGSPCIDAGANSIFLSSVATDLAGDPRIKNGTVDIGAYEGAVAPPSVTYHVNGAGGNDNNSGLSPETAFATIQKGIDSAADGCVVLVHPGFYTERIDFQGKAITVASAGDAAVIAAPGSDAVSFYNGEGADSTLRNFVIALSARGIFVVGSSPTIRHVTFVGNGYAVAAYLGARPSISDCIFWQNSRGDMLGCTARYSRTQDAGEGNIDADALFADPNSGDYHLRSQRGRYRPSTDEWILDRVTSPCVDAGDPTADPSQEPMPNGARIDMGAYGATPFASMSEWPIRADMNFDGKVNLIDLAWMADAWLWTTPWAE